jgi:hypothetical protein
LTLVWISSASWHGLVFFFDFWRDFILFSSAPYTPFFALHRHALTPTASNWTARPSNAISNIPSAQVRSSTASFIQ